MKKTMLLLTIAALLCSCSTAPAETTTTPPTETTTAPMTDESAEGRATGEEETTAPQTVSEEDRSERLRVNTNAFYYAGVDPADLHFYKNEADDSSEYYYTFDYTYGFGASVYDDSTLHPERFDPENYGYTPETEYVFPKPFEIKAGDTVGDYRIGAAHTMIAKLDMGYEEGAILETEIVLDGEYSFTGALRFFYDEDYMIGAGDLRFLPTEPPTGFPLPIGFGAQPSFFLGNTAVYSELMSGLRVGNLFTGNTNFVELDEETGEWGAVGIDPAVFEKLNQILASEKADCQKWVEITLSEITLTWSDQFGTAQSKAKITDIREIS